MKKKVLIGIIVAVAVLIAIVAIVIGTSKNNCKHNDPTQIVVVEAIAPTCQKTGLTEGKKCNLCGTMVVPQSIVKKVECLNYKLLDDGTYSVDKRSSECICTEVVIPNSYQGIAITSIGDYAFSGCSSLTSIEIPDSVTSIGKRAFSGCSSLTSIEIPDSVTSIGEYAFFGCNSIVYNEYDNAYYLGNEINPYLVLIKAKYTNITSCEIYSDTRLIYSRAFWNCSLLTSIAIPDSVTSIGDYAFYGCSSLTSIEIPNSVTSIGEYAFRKCSSLKDVYYTGDVEDWLGISFNIFESTPMYYATNLYFDGELVTSVTIPDSVTSIGDYAFWNCSSLTSIEIPDSVTKIGKGAFLECTSLTNIVIPNSVISIVTSAFSGCRSLTNINFDGTVEQWNAISKGTGWNNNTGDYTIYCTDGQIAKDGTVTYK